MKQAREDIELGDYAQLFLTGNIDNVIAYLKNVRDQAIRLGYDDLLLNIWSVDDFVIKLSGVKTKRKTKNKVAD